MTIRAWSCAISLVFALSGLIAAPASLRAADKDDPIADKIKELDKPGARAGESLAPAVDKKPQPDRATTKQADKPPADAQRPAGETSVEWKTDLVAAKRQSVGKPLLIFFSATWCKQCAELHTEMKRAEVRQALAAWTCVEVDTDDAPQLATQYGASRIPLLVLLDGRGRQLDQQVGVRSARELIDWLRRHRTAAEATVDPLLTATDKPDEAAVGKLLGKLGDADAGIREAAVRRLMPYPAVSAPQALAAYDKANLATRLSILELLTTWRAPVEKLDPWRPETWSPDHKQGLDEWLASAKLVDFERPPLTEAEQKSAARDLARVQIAPDAEAAAIAERLSRLGPLLLPQLVPLLKDTQTDQARERLLELRYRLVATSALTLSWTGGLTRLAATDVETRRKAAGDLVARATARDEPLLLELFADPDPLVRELSLRGLRSAGGQDSAGAIVKLLSDPDANVRAAVLKQLAESPSLKLAPQIAQYAEGETDADLLVHVIRLFRAMGGQTAGKTVLKLLEHPVWQVRAEAAEAAVELANADGRGRRGAGAAPVGNELREQIHAALVERLEDEDPFVISRAMQGAGGSARQMIAAAKKHPELATAVVQALGRSSAVDELMQFARHEKAEVRSAAVKALADAESVDHAELLLTALADEASSVRRVAAEEFLQIHEQVWSRHEDENRRGGDYATDHLELAEPEDEAETSSGLLDKIRSFFGGEKPKSIEKKIDAEPEPVAEDEPRSIEIKPDAAKPETIKPEETTEKVEQEAADTKAAPAALGDSAVPPIEAWATEYQQRQRYPNWMKKAVEPLEKMLASKDADEQLAAALALMPLGRHDKALPIIEQIAQQHPKKAEQISKAFLWLAWPQREALLRRLLAHPLETATLNDVLETFARIPDARARPLLWNLADEGRSAADMITITHQPFERLYRPQRNQSSRSPRPADPQLKQYAATGKPWQQAVALALLLDNNPPAAVEAAQPIFDDAEQTGDMRRDALRVMLIGAPQKKATKLAVAQLKSTELPLRKTAAKYLVRGSDAIGYVRDAIRLSGGSTRFYSSFDSQPGPKEVVAPAGMTLDDVRPLLADSDPEVAASAAYLLATLGEPEGLPLLIDTWRKDGSYSSWTEPLYKAVAVLNSTAHVPLLTEMYEQHENSSVRIGEFYWTIRTMTGPEILALRKRIRAEVGMDRLR